MRLSCWVLSDNENDTKADEKLLDRGILGYYRTPCSHHTSRKQTTITTKANKIAPVMKRSCFPDLRSESFTKSFHSHQISEQNTTIDPCAANATLCLAR